ncbi:ImmA/IrrE family metallo-endopeptidase [Pseudoalteromonas sp. SCSIO 43210]
MQNFQPNWCSPPGATIQSLAKKRAFSDEELMNHLNLENDGLENLLRGFSKLTSEIAERLEHIFGVSKSFWINREENYFQSLVHQANECESWFNELPVSDLVSRGFLNKNTTKPYRIAQCLDFFESKAIDEWESLYKSRTEQVAFRTSNSFDSQPLAVTTWLRLAEIHSADQITKKLNKELLKESLNNIKSLSRIAEPSRFLPKLKSILNECGVKIAVVKPIKGCKASGATFFKEGTPIVALSFRHLSDDHFWFTLFHELGHVILHSHTQVFIEVAGETTDSEGIEAEANEFAMSSLVPEKNQAYLFSLRHKDFAKIMRLARDLDLSPGILVGQLQHKGLVPYSHLNKLKNKYKWG